MESVPLQFMTAQIAANSEIVQTMVSVGPIG